MAGRELAQHGWVPLADSDQLYCRYCGGWTTYEDLARIPKAKLGVYNYCVKASAKRKKEEAA